MNAGNKNIIHVGYKVQSRDRRYDLPTWQDQTILLDFESAQRVIDRRRYGKSEYRMVKVTLEVVEG